MKPRARTAGPWQDLKPWVYLLWIVVVWATWFSTAAFSDTFAAIRFVPRHLAFPWPHAGHAALAAVRSVLSVLAICAVATAAGGIALAFSRLRAGWLTALGAGLPLLALVTQGAGLLGLAFGRLIAMATIVAGLASLRSFGPIRWAGRVPRPVKANRALRILAYTALAVVGVAALAPEASWDAVVYHLRAPSLYLIEHKVHLLPRIPHSTFPFSGEMLFMLARCLGGDPAARLLHAAVWACCGAAVARLAGLTIGAAAMPWAACLFLTMPLGLVLATRAYIEFFVVLPAVLAFGLLAGRRRPGLPTILVAGWLAGAAFGAKYQGGFAAVVLAGLVLYRTRPRLGPPLLFAVSGLAPAVPWLARNFLWTGNPVFPAFFGGLGWTALDARGLAGDSMATQPILRTAATAMGDLLGRLDDGGYPPMLLTAALVPALWRGVRRSPIWPCALALLVLWVFTAPHPRFLVVGAALACAAGAGVVNGFGLPAAAARWMPRVTLAGMWIALGLGFGIIDRTEQPWAAAVGKWTTEEYREIRSAPPGFVDVLTTLEAVVPPRGRAYVIGHVFTYDLPRRVWFDFMFLRPPLYWWLAGAGSPERVLVRARQAGLTHIAHNPYGTWTIFGGRPDLMSWTPAMLGAYTGFWRRHTELVATREAWRIYRIVRAPVAGRAPVGAPPGTEGMAVHPRAAAGVHH